MFWTIEDFNNGLCDMTDLGMERPAPPIEPPQEHPPEFTDTVNENGIPLTARELARSVSHVAVKTLLDVMNNGREDARIRAAQALLDRGWGRTPEEEQRLSPPPATGARATFTAAQVEQIATVMAIGMVEKMAEEAATAPASAPVPAPPPPAPIQPPEPVRSWFDRKPAVQPPPQPVAPSEPTPQPRFWDSPTSPAEGDRRDPGKHPIH